MKPTNGLSVCFYVFTNSRTWTEDSSICVDVAVRSTDRQTYHIGTRLFAFWGLLRDTDCGPGEWQSLLWKRGEGDLGVVMATISIERIIEAIPLLTLAPCPAYFFYPLPCPREPTGLVFVFSRQSRRLKEYLAGTCIPTWQKSGLVGRRSWPGWGKRTRAWPPCCAAKRRSWTGPRPPWTPSGRSGTGSEGGWARQVQHGQAFPLGLWGWKTNKHIESRATPRVLWRS